MTQDQSHKPHFQEGGGEKNREKGINKKTRRKKKKREKEKKVPCEQTKLDLPTLNRLGRKPRKHVSFEKHPTGNGLVVVIGPPLEGRFYFSKGGKTWGTTCLKNNQDASGPMGGSNGQKRSCVGGVRLPHCENQSGGKQKKEEAPQKGGVLVGRDRG